MNPNKKLDNIVANLESLHDDIRDGTCHAEVPAHVATALGLLARLALRLAAHVAALDVDLAELKRRQDVLSGLVNDLLRSQAPSVAADEAEIDKLYLNTLSELAQAVARVREELQEGPSAANQLAVANHLGALIALLALHHQGPGAPDDDDFDDDFDDDADFTLEPKPPAAAE